MMPIVVCAVLMVVCVLVLIRNQFVFLARSHFINNEPDFPRSYYKLPTYEQMLYLPKYWLLWTPTHWKAWVARQEQGVAA